MVKRRNRFFFYFFSLNIIVILLYIILTPIVLKSIVKKSFKNASIEFQTMDINIFKNISVSGLSYNTDNIKFTSDYVDIGVSAVNLFLKKYKINYLKVISSNLIIKKLSSNTSFHMPNFILNNISIKNMNIYFSENNIKDIFLMGSIDSRKKTFVFSQISALVDIKEGINKIPIIACRFNGNWKKDIVISEGKLYTANTKVSFKGHIKDGKELIFTTDNLKLKELNKYILFGKKNDMHGIGSGYLKLHFSKGNNLLYGNFTSPLVNLADLLFKNVKLGIKVSFKEERVYLYFKKGTLFDSPISGGGFYAHKELKLSGKFSHLNIGNIFIKSQTGTKTLSSLNGEGNIYYNFNEKKVVIDFFNVNGKLLKQPVISRTSLKLDFDTNNNRLNISEGQAYGENGDIGIFSITGNALKKQYNVKIDKIVKNAPMGSKIIGKIFANVDNKKISGEIYPEKIKFKNNFIKYIDIKGKIKFSNVNDTLINLQFIPSKIDLFKNSYSFMGYGIKIKGKYKDSLKLKISPIKKTNRSNYFIDISYDKQGKLKGNGVLSLEKIKKDGKIDDLLADFKMYTKGRTHHISFNTNELMMDKERLLSKESFVFTYNMGKIAGIITGENISGSIDYHNENIKGNLEINKFDINRALSYINAKEGEFSGLFSTKIAFDDTLTHPSGNITFKIDNFARHYKYIGLLQGELSYRDHILYLEKINAYHKLYYMNAKGFIPLNFSIYPFSVQILDKPFEVNLDLADVKPEFLQYLFIDIPYIVYKKKLENFPFKGSTGSFNGKMKLYGTFESPNIDSKIMMRDMGGNIKIGKEINYDISKTNGNIILNYGEHGFNLTLQDIRFDIGQNKNTATFNINGLANYDNDETKGQIMLKLINGLFPIDLNEYKTNINSLSLQLKLSKVPEINGNIVISNGKIKKTFFNIIDYAVNSIQKKKFKKNPIKKLSILSDFDLLMDINVSSANPVSFPGTDQNFTISFKNLNIKGRNNDLKLGGNINILGGEVYKFGSTFTFLPSFINFVNSEFIDPNLDISMQSLITGIRVNIDISGKYSEPNIQLSSVPHFSSLQILSLILFKDIELYSLKNSIYSLGMNLLLSELTGELFKLSGKTSLGYVLSKLIDNIKIERMSVNDAGEFINRWRFSLGKYVFPELYIGYSRFDNIKYDQLLEFKIFINPQLVLSIDLNISPYETRSFGDSIYIMMIREFDMSNLFKIRK
ncbi:translocation/assembly module TamB domain-containing protein [bacterium]|nr:translocation/assembly module TamB domain-containing protein [bacterium]